MKKVKLSDVAAEAGVSTATVSRVLNHSGYVSDDMRELVLQAAQKTGYRVAEEPAAEQGPGKLVGIILAKRPYNLYHESLEYALAQELERQGMYAITVFAERVTNEVIRRYAEIFLAYGVCGMVITGMIDSKIRPDVRSFLLKAAIPVVFIERIADSSDFNQVCVNNTLGGYIAAKHLIRNGHRKILYISRGTPDNDAGSRRLQGFLEAVQDESDPPEYYIATCPDQLPVSAYLAMKEAEVNFPGFTAVQAWYDGYLIGTIEYLKEKGLRTPEDIELIAQDDTYSRIVVPNVSSVRLPFEEMAKNCVDIIMEWQDTTKEHFVKRIDLNPKLILRGVPDV